MRSCILISVVCALTAFGSTQPGPGFDPKEVARQIHARRGIAGTTLAAPSATRRSGDSGRVSGRQSTGSPGLSEPDGGQSLDGGEFLIDTSSALVPAPGSQTGPALAFDGTNFLVVWEDCRSGSYTDICGARVTPDGTVLDPSGLVVSQAAYDQRSPALAFDGTDFLVVWDDYRRGHAFDIYGARVTPGGTVLDPAGIIITQTTNDQRYPDVGFDGTDYLVVWQDHYYDVEGPDICGTRVTPGGTVLDASALVIAQAPHGQYSPALAFDGANFLVTWADSRDTTGTRIYGTRVAPDGTVLDTSGIMISTTAGTQRDPALAFDGANYLVAWTDVRGSFPPQLDIYGTRVTPAGGVLDSSGIAVTQASGVQGVPAVGFDGTDFLAIWQDFRNGVAADIYGARVTPAGEVLDADGLVITQAADAQGAPAVGFGGARFLTVWQDQRNDPAEPDIYGARVTPAGEVLDAGGLVIAQAARQQSSPALASDGANYLVVWEDTRNGSSTDIYGARVAAGGAVLDPAGIAIAQATNDQSDPALGFDGTNFLVAWQDYRNSTDDPDIYGARVTPGGEVLDPAGIAIAQATGSQSVPALGFGSADFLVVWEDQRGGGLSDIYGARVAPDGTVLDPGGLVITQATDRQCNPVVGFDGGHFLAVWGDYRVGDGSHIYGARVATGGTVLDPNGIVIAQAANTQVAPALGFDGTNSLVVWEDYRSSVLPDIYGTRVTPGGSVLDTAGIAIARAAKGQYAPALAFDGAKFLVVYEDYRSSNNPDIYGAWVVPGDTIYDEGGVVRQEGNQCCLALARGAGSQLFLAYEGWAGTVGGKTYNTDRIWGELNPMPGGGVAETPSAELRTTPAATIVRGVLLLGAVDRGQLLDAAGRKVMDLRPGANDVSHLAPGVYFVRSGPSAVTKVVVTR